MFGFACVPATRGENGVGSDLTLVSAMFRTWLAVTISSETHRGDETVLIRLF